MDLLMWRLLLFGFVVLSLAQDAPTVKAPEKLADVKLEDYLNALKAIEDSASSRIENVNEAAEEAKRELYDSLTAKIKQIRGDKASQANEKVLELEKLKQQLMDQYKAETDRIFLNAVDAVQKYKDEYAAAQVAEKEKVREKYEEFKKTVNETMQKKMEEMRSRTEEVNAYLKQVDDLYQKHQAESAANMEQRRQSIKDKLTATFGDIKNRSEDIKAQEDQVRADIQSLLQAKLALQKDVDAGVREGIKELLTENLERKLESQLEKEMRQVVSDEVRQKLHPKSVKPSTDSTVGPALKATLLDTLTGASAWETVAWVLLGLCILLSIALIAMIVYQVSQRNKYNRLEGSNSPRPPLNERAPLYPSNTAPPLPYTQEKAVSPSIPAAGPSAPGPAPPAEETQQF